MMSCRLVKCAVLIWLFSVLSSRASDAPLPWVDLDQRSGMHVVVDREAGQYLGHPTTAMLEDSRTIHCVYPKGHGRGAIIHKRSDDGGVTWSQRLPTPKSWETSLETPTIHRLVGGAGEKRLIVFSGLYPVRSARSDDDGRTWTELEPIGDWGGVVAMASVIQLNGPAGAYRAYFHDDGRFIAKNGKATGQFTLYSSLTIDGGLKWSRPESIYASKDVHLCEPGAIRSPDGKQIALLLRENRRVRQSHIVFSNDEGKTWTAPRELPATLTGDRHVGQYAPDGRLFLSFRDMAKDSPTYGDWIGWIGKYQDLVDGHEGQYRVRIKKNHFKIDCAYPGVERLADGTIVATTYGHWTAGEPPYILAARFRLNDLEALLPAKRH